MDLSPLYPKENIRVGNPMDLSATIHLLAEGLQVFSASSEYYQQICVSENLDKPIMTMYFCLNGICEAQDTRDPTIYTVHSNQHIVGFSPNFEGQYSIKGNRISSFGVSMTEQYFKRLMVSDLDCLQRFWEKVALNQDADIAAVPLSILPEQRNLIGQLQRCNYSGQMKQLYYESKVVELFLSQALQAEALNDTKVRSLSETDIVKLHDAKAFVESHLLDPLKMRDVCKEVGLNDFKLKKGFKELFGMTVFGYFNKVRMQYARQLFLDTSKSVFEVAYMLGYSDPYNFTKAFKRHFGYLPSQFKTYS